MKIFKRENGMSLAEVMVAAGIMGGLALVVAQLMKNQNEVMTHAEAKNEEMELVSQMRTILSRKEACEASFGGSSLDTTVDEVRNSSNNMVFEVGQVYGNRALRLNQLTLSNENVPPGGGVGEAILTIEMERIKKDDGQMVIERDLMLQVSTDASGTIDECYSDTSNTIETAKEEMCESINGVYDPDTSTCDLNCISDPGESNEAVSSECLDGIREDERQISEDSYVNVDGDTMTGDLKVNAQVQADRLVGDNAICLGTNCRTTFADQDCSPGQVVRKINSDGTVECADVTCSEENEAFMGIDSNGEAVCRPVTRITSESGRVAHNDSVPVPDSFTRSECNLIVTMEDHHYGSNRTGFWSDSGKWHDNHYGGGQAFYDNNWRVTCRFGLTAHDDRNPSWRYASQKRCRYLVVCHSDKEVN